MQRHRAARGAVDAVGAADAADADDVASPPAGMSVQQCASARHRRPADDQSVHALM